MNQSELLQLLDRLCRIPHETEWIEFKEAKNQYHFNEIGKYFSALSNEANLKKQACGWLIFGVKKDHSICGSHFREDPAKLDRLKKEVADQTNENITFEDIYVANHPNGRVVMLKIPPALAGIPTAWQGHFYGRDGESLGALSLGEIGTIRSQSSDNHQTNPDWNQSPSAPELTGANLLGEWNEKNKADLEIIGQLASEEYGEWIPKIREVLQQAISPVNLKNGKWHVVDRKGLWQELGRRVFDNDLDKLRQCAVTVLSERDPQFELAPEQRIAAQLYGKVLKYSPELRKGLAETLALLGARPDALTNCSRHKAEASAVLAIREIFENPDWVLWGSLNDLLPILAEVAPGEFLDAVEKALQQTPCPFDELFSQERHDRNYLTGLLWALEKLAWDAGYIIRVCVVLGELAEHDPVGNSMNCPAHSLATILLPWRPQTTAPIDKRKAAIRTLQHEVPRIAWELLLSLLTDQMRMTRDTPKPVWRNIIPDDWKEDVTQGEYGEQVSAYAEMAVAMASNDGGKLTTLVSHMGNLPQPSFDKFLEHLSSEEVRSQSEDQRLELWDKLEMFASRQRRYANEKWTLSSDIVTRVEDITMKLAPTNPSYAHRRLFSYFDFDLYEEDGNRKEQEQKLKERRHQAIKDILAYGGIDAVVRFAEVVGMPQHVGHIFGTIAKSENDTSLLPALLETDSKQISTFIVSYVLTRQYRSGWAWADGLDKSAWSASQIGQFLAYLPFTKEAWTRVAEWLGKSEKEYWSRTQADSYNTDGDLGFAVDKLIEHGRPDIAIACLSGMLHKKQPLDIPRSVRALLAPSTRVSPLETIDVHRITELIKALQESPDTAPEDLCKIEWAYLSLPDQPNSASPKLLENRLASDPDFFCEVLRLAYPSKKERQSKEAPTERDRANASKLLFVWRTPPGTIDGEFIPEQFTRWLEQVKKTCSEAGHLEVVLSHHIGEVLIHAPPDPEGLWIHRAVAATLNAKDAERIRDSFRLGIYNSRSRYGMHEVDPMGKPEHELAAQYRQKAEAVENAGYHRFAGTLRKLAEGYEREAERNIDRYEEDSRMDRDQ